jgi:methionyl aminopeptidase
MNSLKSPDEVAKMRQAGRMVHRVIHETGKHIVPGVTTSYLEEIAIQIISEAGGSSPCLGYAPYGHPPYPAWTCISVNEEIVHAIPGPRILQEGDLVTIDCCAELNGWLADSAFTFPVGKVSNQAARLLKVTEECLYKGIAQAKPGNRTGDIGYAVQRHAEDAGFSVVRELSGHGIGRKMHEGELHVPNYGYRGKGMVLKEGMTFAIEPMINVGTPRIRTRPDGWTIVTQDGKLSAHFEHTVAITLDGAEILTNGD